MTTGITYRIAKAADYSAILHLYNNAYQANRSEQDLAWLYDDNPMGKGTIFIAFHNNEVIGMQGIVRYQFWKDGKIINTYKSEDSLTNANYRGKGVYKTLYQMVFDFIGSELIWGLTDIKTILERTGLPSKHRFILAACVNGLVDPSLFKGEKKRLAKSMVYSLVGLRSKFTFGSRCKIKKNRSIELTDFGNIEAFGIKLSKQYPDIKVPVLSKKMIHWRLRDNPKVKSWKVYVTHDEKLKIKALTLITFDGQKCRWLSSYFLKTIDKDARKQHVIEVKKQLFAKGIKIIEQWIFDTNQVSAETKNVMLSSGFKKIKNGLWIINNEHRADESVDEILFSGQLGLD